MRYQVDLGGVRYRFPSLRVVMAKASPPRSGDQLAGAAATSEQERMAARWVLSEVPLRLFLEEPLIPYESDEVNRLNIDTPMNPRSSPSRHKRLVNSGLAAQRGGDTSGAEKACPWSYARDGCRS